MDEKRLIEIETKVSYQEMVIEKLNQVVIDQQKTIEKLETIVTSLTKRFGEALGSGDEIRANEKPPHY